MPTFSIARRLSALWHRRELDLVMKRTGLTNIDELASGGRSNHSAGTGFWPSSTLRSSLRKRSRDAASGELWALRWGPSRRPAGRQREEPGQRWPGLDPSLDPNSIIQCGMQRD
jgi:hypothetical protein